MTTSFPGDPTQFPALIVTPSDGELRAAASVQTPYSQLADRTAALHAGVSAGALLNWTFAQGQGAAGEFENSASADRDMRGGDVDPVTLTWLLAGNTDGCQKSTDDGLSFQAFDGGMATAIGLQDVAIGAASSAVAVGASATVYQRATILSGSWGTVVVPGVPIRLTSIVYDTFNTRFIVVGEKAADAPFGATSDDATGTAFTDRSATIPAGFASVGLESLAVNTAGLAVAGTDVAHNKLAFTTNGGLNWQESTTTVASGQYDVAWSITLGKFFAIRRTDATTNNVYESTDGDTWTSVFSGSIGFNTLTGSGNGHSVACYGTAVGMLGFIDNEDAIGLSFDGGVTWSIQMLRAQAGAGGGGGLISSRSNSKLIAISSRGAASARKALG